MGGRQSSTAGSSVTNSPMGRNGNGGHHSAPGSSALSGSSSSREPGSSSTRFRQVPASDWRQRARSLSNVINGQPGSDTTGGLNHAVGGVSASGMGLSFGISGSPD